MAGNDQVPNPLLFLMSTFPAPAIAGYSISYALGMGIIGSSIPMIATWLIDKTSLKSSPAYLLAVSAFIAIAAAWKMRTADEAEPFQ